MGGKGVFPNALPIYASCVFVHWRCASGERDAVRDVLRFPPGGSAFWVREPMVWPDRMT